MFYTACPHCGLPLHMGREHQGQTMQCLRCRGAFIVPVVPPPVGTDSGGPALDEETQIPAAVWWVMIAVGHVVAVVLLAIPLSLGGAIAAVLLAVAAELMIWQWSAVAKGLEFAYQRLDRATRASTPVGPSRPATQQELGVPRPTAFSSLASSVTSPHGESQSERSSQAHPVQATRSETIPPPRESYELGSAPPPHSGRITNWWQFRAFAPAECTLNEQGAELPSADIRFFGSGTVLDLGRGLVESPLVYATNGPCYGNFDASLIDGALAVSAAGGDAGERLPYWPSYFEASPEQRSRYLDWLAGGRCDPNVELGYVFVYFYGLERRIVIDAADHDLVVRELLRLRRIYSSSRSFDRYSTALLWLAIALSTAESPVSSDSVEEVIASTRRWDGDVLACFLAHQYQRFGRLTPEAAFRVAKEDSRCPSSVVVRRHEALFQELFTKRYAARFGDGFELKAGKRSKPLHYHPASATLLRWTADCTENTRTAIPDVLAIGSQFKVLVAIWEECIAELRAYDKAHRVGGDQTVDAFESLPPDLRLGEHPQFDDWLKLWHECGDESSVPIVPIGRLASLRDINQRTTLLKAQCRKILQTADCLGIGVEPDARLTGKNYRWDDAVILFFSDEPGRDDPGRYQAASALMQLGIYVAAADGAVDQDEADHILRHLESQFELSAEEIKRLECLRHLLSQRPQSDRDVAAILRKSLPEQKRRLVGEYLVGVAASDQVITPAEHRALRKLYDRLGLDESHLNKILEPLQPAAPLATTGKALPERKLPSGFHLDLAAISRIMSETRAVAAIIKDAMAEEADQLEDETSPDSAQSDFSFSSPDSTSCGVAVLPTTAKALSSDLARQVPQLASLEPRYHAFLSALLCRDQWPLDEAKSLSRQHNVMLAGAIEAVNEWSCDNFGDWLIEDGNPLVVRSSLLQEAA